MIKYFYQLVVQSLQDNYIKKEIKNVVQPKQQMQEFLPPLEFFDHVAV